jgi:hypothetical protein
LVYLELGLPAPRTIAAGVWFGQSGGVRLNGFRRRPAARASADFHISLRIPCGTLTSSRRHILRQYRSHMLSLFSSLGDRKEICEFRSLIHLLNRCAPLHCSLGEKRYLVEVPAGRLDQNIILVLLVYCLLSSLLIASRIVCVALRLRGGRPMDDCPVLLRQPRGGLRSSYIDPAQH